MNKTRLVVLFGGRTCEHDVSIITAQQFMDNADTAKYEIIPVYITREGAWYTGEKLRDMAFMNAFDASAVKEVSLSATAGLKELIIWEKKLGGFKKSVIPIDVAVPAMHGMHGEDGTLQGLLELADIPYVGSGVLGSAVGMDKIVMKSVFRDYGFPVLEAVAFDRYRYQQDRSGLLFSIEEKLPYPMYVKPANLGSSIGISRADNRAALEEGIAVALHYDKRVLVEKGVEELMEVNCSVLGVGADVRASVLEQPVSWKEYLTFEDKYMRGGKGTKGMQSLSRIVPAPIGEDMTKRIQDMSAEVFRALDCGGVVRIDYIIDKKEQALYVNEINTIPGSFAFYLWEEEGLPYPQLIDKLVEGAFAAHRQKKENQYSFDSTLLQKFKGGLGGSKGTKHNR